MLRHAQNRLLNLLLQFGFLHALVRKRIARGHEIHELAAVVVAGIDRRLQGIRRAARLAANQIARFVRGDREEPRTESPRGIELVGGLMYLKERLLEHILRRGAIAKEAHQEMEQLALIALHKLRET